MVERERERGKGDIVNINFISFHKYYNANIQNKMRRNHSHKVDSTMDKPVSSEMFVALVTERLLAVEKDRKAREQRVRDDARQKGKSYEEIMVRKHLTEEGGREGK